MKSFLVLFIFALVLHGQDSPLLGKWTAIIQGKSYEFNFKLDHLQRLSGTVHLSSENKFDVKVDFIKVDQPKITFSVSALRATFKGKFESTDNVKGRWSENGRLSPIQLKKVVVKQKKEAVPFVNQR